VVPQVITPVDPALQQQPEAQVGTPVALDPQPVVPQVITPVDPALQQQPEAQVGTPVALDPQPAAAQVVTPANPDPQPVVPQVAPDPQPAAAVNVPQQPAVANAPDTWAQDLGAVNAVLKSVRDTPAVPPAVRAALAEMLGEALAKKQNDRAAAQDLLRQVQGKALTALMATGWAADAPAAVPDRDAKANLAREKAEAELALQSIIAALPVQVDLSRVERIVQDHAQQAPQEAQAFGDYHHIEDVTAIKDDAARTAALNKIREAVEGARGRQADLTAALRAVPWPQNKDVENIPAKDRQAFREAHGLVMRMTAHLPEEWLAAWTPNFADRLNNLALPPDEKKRKLAQVQATPATPEELAVYRKFVEKGAAKNLERADFYFDQFVMPADPKDAKEIAQVQQKLLNQAHQIRDLGGTLRDCEKVFAGLPPQWWPPEFIEEMQAWRKTERALQEERVQAAMKRRGKSNLDTAQDVAMFILEAVGSQGGTVADLGKKGSVIQDGTPKDHAPAPSTLLGQTALTGPDLSLPKDHWANNLDVLKQMATYATFIKTNLETFKDLKEYAERGEWKKVKEGDAKAMADAAEKFLQFGSQIMKDVSIIASAKGVADPTSDLVTKVLPGISLATAGIDLFAAVKKCIEHRIIKNQTAEIKRLAERQFAEGAEQDGGAFLGALTNELDARNRQAGKDALDVTTKTLDLVGAVGDASGVGAVTAAAIKITSKGIKYGGKLVFTAIDWSLAANAKKLIREAQAGNPVARMQLFEDSALYAKMYIALLVQEGNRLAKQFIVDRGIEEGDLGSGMGLQILRKALMKGGDQKDETTFDAAVEMANVVSMGKVVEAGRWAAEKIEKIRDAHRNNVTREGSYDRKKEVRAPDLTAATWGAAKQEAMANHLHNEPTGITPALKKVEAARQQADATAGKGDAAAERAARLAHLDALTELYQVVTSYSPYTVPQGQAGEVLPHAGMTKHLAELTNKVRAQIKAIDEHPTVKLTEARANFRASPPGRLDAASHWAQVHARGVKEAHLPPNDSGLGAALTALEGALEVQATDTSGDKQKQREARLKVSAAGGAVLKAAQAYWVECAAVEGMRDYLTGLINLVREAMKSLDGQLFEATGWQWSHKGKSDEQKFTLAVWNATWAEASLAGAVLASAKDGGVGAALAEVEKKQAAYALATAAAPPQKLAARKELKAALAKVVTAVAACAGAQKDLVADLDGYCATLRAVGARRMAALTGEQKAIGFQCPPADLTVTQWMKAYNTAIEAGAAAPGQAGPALAVGLKNYQTAKLKGPVELTAESRKVVNEARAKLVQAQQALAAAQAECADATPLVNYLTSVAGQLSAEAAALAKVLKQPGPAVQLPAFAWSSATWGQVEKLAVANGLLDAGSGFGKLLDDAQAKFLKADAATATSTQMGEAKAALKKVMQAAVAGEKATGNADLQGYWRKCREETDLKLAALP
jgi:hypothetical protein